MGSPSLQPWAALATGRPQRWRRDTYTVVPRDQTRCVIEQSHPRDGGFQLYSGHKLQAWEALVLTAQLYGQHGRSEPLSERWDVAVGARTDAVEASVGAAGRVAGYTTSRLMQRNTRTTFCVLAQSRIQHAMFAYSLEYF